jgi:lipopolysaccharide transport system permease protein
LQLAITIMRGLTGVGKGMFRRGDGQAAPRGYTVAPPRMSDFWETIANLVDYAGLFRVFVWRQISVRYRQSLFGIFWVVLQPLATTLVVFFMFRIIGADTSGGLPPGLFLFVGVMTWQFFSRGVQDGAMSLRNNSNILTRIYFPRVVLPIAGVLTAWFEIVIMLSLLLVVCVIQGVPMTPRLLLLPVFLVLVSFASLSLSVWLAPINALVRDITFILPFALQFGMYASPVLYGGHLVPARWQLAFYLNPLSTLIEGARWSIFRDAPAPDPLWLAVNVITIFVVLVGGLAVFQACESAVVDRI